MIPKPLRLDIKVRLLDFGVVPLLQGFWPVHPPKPRCLSGDKLRRFLLGCVIAGIAELASWRGSLMSIPSPATVCPLALQAAQLLSWHQDSGDSCPLPPA